MSRDLNKVMIIGRLTKNPDKRSTANGAVITSFTVASGRTWKTPAGDTKDETEFVHVVTWDKLAEICGQYLVKGSKVYIEGRLQTRRWKGREGDEHFTTEVIAQDMIILDDKDKQPAGATTIEDGIIDEDEIEFEPPSPSTYKQTYGQY